MVRRAAALLDDRATPQRKEAWAELYEEYGN